MAHTNRFARGALQTLAMSQAEQPEGQMVKGRLPCIKLPPGHMLDALEPHVTWPLQWCLRYSQLRFRLRPKWLELFMCREFARDAFEVTDGYCVTQKYLEEEVKTLAVVLKNPPEKGKVKKKLVELSPQELEEVENLVYRMRAAMAHVRNARLHGHTPPARFGIRKGLIALAKTGAPPQLADSPKRDKVAERNCLVRAHASLWWCCWRW